MSRQFWREIARLYGIGLYTAKIIPSHNRVVLILLFNILRASTRILLCDEVTRAGNRDISFVHQRILINTQTALFGICILQKNGSARSLVRVMRTNRR